MRHQLIRVYPTVFTTAKSCNQPKSRLIDKQTEAMWHIRAREFYFSPKKTKLYSFQENELEVMRLSEISQSVIYRTVVCSHMWICRRNESKEGRGGSQRDWV